MRALSEKSAFIENYRPAMKLEDIARKAGVSRATVSRVINNERYVSTQTRDRVMAVIREEHFEPNPAARALVTQRSEIIGIVIPDNVKVFFTDNSYFPMLLQGIGEATHQREYAMLLWLGQPEEDRDVFVRRVVSNRQVDGLIIASLSNEHPLFAHLQNLRVPFVMIDRPLRFDERISYVTIDNVRAAEMAVVHLASVGCKRIAHITGHLTISDGVDRLQGYKNGLKKVGLPLDKDLIVEGQFHSEHGYVGMKKLLAYKPDAVFAAGDTSAVGAMQAIREAGLRIPEDIAVMGVDDIDVAERADPPLTTIRQPVEQKGAYAARLLMDLIEGRVEGPQHVVLPTQLVIRQSCGAQV
jgi:LacI family transcriptional regulator